MNQLNARIGNTRPSNTRPTQKQIDRINMKGFVIGAVISCVIGAVLGVIMVIASYHWLYF